MLHFTLHDRSSSVSFASSHSLEDDPESRKNKEEEKKLQETRMKVRAFKMGFNQRIQEEKEKILRLRQRN